MVKYRKPGPGSEGVDRCCRISVAIKAQDFKNADVKRDILLFELIDNLDCRVKAGTKINLMMLLRRISSRRLRHGSLTVQSERLLTRAGRWKTSANSSRRKTR